MAYYFIYFILIISPFLAYFSFKDKIQLKQENALRFFKLSSMFGALVILFKVLAYKKFLVLNFFENISLTEIAFVVLVSFGFPLIVFYRYHSTHFKKVARKRLIIYASIIGLYFVIKHFPFPFKNTEGIKDQVYFDSYQIEQEQMPLFYHDEYNVTLGGLEKLHPFDSEKYGRIYEKLKKENLIQKKDLPLISRPSPEYFKNLIDQDYLNTMRDPIMLTQILELPFLAGIPWRVSYNQILVPMEYATGGSIMAARTALERGTAINLGGGFHHAHKKGGGGFCAFPDIAMIVDNLRRNKLAQKILIIDLDAHQGNGHERDFMHDKDVFIIDIYNGRIYPNDIEAKKAIDIKVELGEFMEDQQYLGIVDKSLKDGLEKFNPDIIIYNAGTDILEGDPLGRLSISPDGILKRDELVFTQAKDKNVPLVMLLSGGYQPNNAEVIANSIKNLMAKKLFK